MKNQQELVIGCGPVGQAVLRQLEKAGIPAIAASRHRPESISTEWVKLDASQAEDVAKLADSVSTIYLCAAPPLTEWTEEFDGIIEGVLEGIRGTDTVLVYASNLYAYGEQEGPLTEQSPELASGAKGKLRARLDHRILEAGGPRCAVVRGSSFYGPEVATSRAGAAELKALRDGQPIPALGSADQPHSMTYIDDFARAMVNIAHNESALGQIWHAPVQPALTQRELLTKFGQRLDAEPKFRIAGDFLVKFLGLFNPTMRALKDTFYVHAEPFVASSEKYNTAFNDGPTELDVAIDETLRSNQLI